MSNYFNNKYKPRLKQATSKKEALELVAGWIDKVKFNLMMQLVISILSFSGGFYYFKQSQIIEGWLFMIPLLVVTAVILKLNSEYKYLTACKLAMEGG